MITTTSSNDSDEPDLRHVQRISRETVEYLRNMKNITTDRIERGVTEALRKSGVIAKVEHHDALISDHERRWNLLYRKFTAAFGNFMHMDDNQERKK